MNYPAYTMVVLTGLLRWEVPLYFWLVMSHERFWLMYFLRMITCLFFLCCELICFAYWMACVRDAQDTHDPFEYMKLGYLLCSHQALMCILS